MRIIWRTSSVLFLILVMKVIVVGCANNSSTSTQTNEMKQEIAIGTLTGKVMRGPMCPVERENKSCPPEPASGVKLLILTPAGREINSVVTDSQGVYGISLPPGTYRIEMPPLSGMEFTKDLPTTVIIIEGRERRLDIHIDTGIR